MTPRPRPPHGRPGCEPQFVTPKRLLEAVEFTRWAGKDRLVVQVTQNVMGQPVGRLVTPRPVLLQTLHHNPIQIPAHQVNQLRRLGMTLLGDRGPVGRLQSADSGRRPERFLLPDDPPHLAQSRRHQFFLVKRRPARQEVRRATPPTRKCRCACQCPACSSPPAPDSYTPACR